MITPKIKSNIKFLTILLAFFINVTIIAKAPYISDSPQSTDDQTWSALLFSNYDSETETVTLDSPSFQIERGFTPNLSINITIPYSHDIPQENHKNSGFGDIQSSATYRFIEETANTPQVGFVPIIFFPTGDASRNLGNGDFLMRLPIWLQKSWDEWTTFGGGGYTVNLAPETKNYSFGGWVLERKFGSYFNLGGELYTQGAVSSENESFTQFNLGTTLNFTDNFGLQMSAGQTIIGEKHHIAFLGLYWNSPKPK